MSIALSREASIWLDGHQAGKAPLAYLRLRAKKHTLTIVHPRFPTQSFQIEVTANRHLSLGRHKNQKLGIYFVRGERSEVQIYKYPKGGGKVLVTHRPPGPYCLKPRLCIFLLPGEELYIQASGQHVLVPPRKALLATRPFPARADSGFLTLYSYPPAALFLNRRMYAMTPVARLPLAPGHYKARLRNGYLGVEQRLALRIRAGQHQRKIVYLAPPKGSQLRITSRQPAQIFINGEYRGWTPARALLLAPGQHRILLHLLDGKAVTSNIVLKKNQSKALHLP